MYWQVYLHKTSLAAEQLLIRVLKRAKELVEQGNTLPASTALSYFLKYKINAENFNAETLEVFATLDDFDIISAMKEWMHHEDFVLCNLCEMIINRKLLKVKLKKKPINPEKLEKHKNLLQQKYNISAYEASYFVFSGEVSNLAYDPYLQNINILFEKGKIADVAKASDQLNLKALSKTVTKNYICYPKHKD